MDRVLSFITFQEEQAENPALAYWMSRSPDERIAQVERLRREYRDGNTQGLCGSLLLVERERR